MLKIGKEKSVFEDVSPRHQNGLNLISSSPVVRVRSALSFRNVPGAPVSAAIPQKPDHSPSRFFFFFCYALILCGLFLLELLDWTGTRRIKKSLCTEIDVSQSVVAAAAA